MTKIHTRIFAILAAVTFLGTSVALSVAVILQMVQDKKVAKETSSPTQSINENKDTNMLQGTKLDNFTPTATVDGLQKIDQTIGTGDEVKPGDTVTAHYTGAIAATGIIFQSSHDTGKPIPFSLTGVIKGWTDGVPGMKVGGKRRLLIPADQAYGPNPPPGSNIPANAVLVFDIEIVKIGE